jgi:hypothetical protein
VTVPFPVEVPDISQKPVALSLGKMIEASDSSGT